MLIEGVWQSEDTSYMKDGRFQRAVSPFRSWITKDGSSGFPAEAGRYHLYVSFACPWAHRTLIVRKLKKLEDVISVSIVHPYMTKETGWTFEEYPGSTGDSVNGAKRLSEIYVKADPRFTGRVVVPVLWDKVKETIVSNESSDIIMMLNREFDTPGTVDLYPVEHRSHIDELNQEIYSNLNNAVYLAGFTSIQEEYEQIIMRMFLLLDRLDERLGHQRFLFGEEITLADVKLFTTLIRFDAVYYGHFKCSKRRIEDYAHLPNYIRDVYQLPGIAETVNFDHIKLHYYRSHHMINPSRIIAVWPEHLDFNKTHNRHRLSHRSLSFGRLSADLFSAISDLHIPLFFLG